MTAQLSIYDFDSVSVIVAGITLDGFADGEGVKIEANVESLKYVSGPTLPRSPAAEQVCSVGPERIL